MSTKSVVIALSAVLLLVGILGFINDPVFGIFEVDTFHNMVHIASGLAGIFMASKSEASAKTFAKVFGVIYGLVAILGLLQGHETQELLGLMEVNGADHYLHLFLTVIFLYFGFKGERRMA